MKKIKGHFCSPSHPSNPSHQTGGRGKELVGKGLDTVRARLATIPSRLVIVCATQQHYDLKKEIPQTKFAKISKFCYKIER